MEENLNISDIHLRSKKKVDYSRDVYTRRIVAQLTRRFAKTFDFKSGSSLVSEQNFLIVILVVWLP